MKIDYEVLIVGGGPAGLSSALTLGRMSRTALVCDDDQPRNAASSHINNFITRDGIHPEEWRKQARKDLEKYKIIEFFQGAVSSVTKNNHGFSTQLSNGSTVNVKKVILAYGVKDQFPAASGFKELWGKNVFHCPFCHGYEIKGSRLGIVSNIEATFHSLPMIYSLSNDLILFSNGKATFNQEQINLLKRKNIELIETPIQSLNQKNNQLEFVALTDGRQVQRDHLFLAPQLPFKLKSNIGESLGCEKTELGFYKVSFAGETTVKGIFAAGDNTSMMHSVLAACAAGAMAGAMISGELTSEILNS